MTLILAIDSAEALLLASDGQSTFSTGGQPVKGYGEKLHSAWDNVIWGGSGPTGMIQEVGHALASKIPNANAFAAATVHQARTALRQVVADTVREVLNNRWIQAPSSQPWSSYLFAGAVPEGPFILEVHQDLTDTDHIGTGFAAIGSGDIFPYFAMAGLKHFDVNNRTLVEAKLITYRILQDAINVAAHGLGPPIQMMQVLKQAGGPGIASKIPQAELEAIAARVAEWKQIESEALSDFVGINAAAAPVINEAVPPDAVAHGLEVEAVAEAEPPGNELQAPA